MSSCRGRVHLKQAVEQVRTELGEADRIHAENLATIRQAAKLIQRALADAMGVNQSEVSRIESRSDLLLSTLAGYLTAAGADHPRVVLTLNGRDVELDLNSLTRA
jgi:transcriptional regulator with XRE-family HTH domain